MKQYWYDLAMSPVTTIIDNIESLEGKGWEIVSTSWTNSVISQPQKIATPNNPNQGIPVLMILARKEKTEGEERPRIA